jgi:hypothetical protein
MGAPFVFEQDFRIWGFLGFFLWLCHFFTTCYVSRLSALVHGVDIYTSLHADVWAAHHVGKCWHRGTFPNREVLVSKCLVQVLIKIIFYYFL